MIFNLVLIIESAGKRESFLYHGEFLVGAVGRGGVKVGNVRRDVAGDEDGGVEQTERQWKEARMDRDGCRRRKTSARN